MNKFLTGAAACALILSSCTQNDLIDAPNSGVDDGKVRFSATSNLTTRSNPFASTGDLQNLGFFQVEGFSGDDQLVKATGTNAVEWKGSSWEYSNEPYWPNGTMTFIAYANWPGTGTKGAATASPDLLISSDGISSNEITISPDALGAGGQSDLLVAVTKDATKQVRTLLTFKHALTQVVFKAGNIAPNELEVVIGEVEIVNVSDKGSMNQFTGNPGEKISWGVVPTDKVTSYSVAGIDNSFANGHKVSDVKATQTDYSKYPRIQTAAEPNNNALMLIPQTFGAWDPNSGSAATPATQDRAYIRLRAAIRKPLDGGAYTEHAQKYLYAGTWTGENTNPDLVDIYIPVESTAGQVGEWQAGKRINYIITFGEKNSGSGGGGYDNDGDPILVPIRFRAVVEDWVESEVPLLSANFSASSSQIDGPFVNGYTKQLLNDVKAAPAAKVFKSSITLSGNVTNNTPFTSPILTAADFLANINTLSTPALVQLNSKFRPGSTLTYDFTATAAPSVTDANKLTVDIPSGWQATYGGAVVTATTTIDLKTTNKTVVLTKLPVSGYDFTCSVPYIEDIIGAIEANENGAAVGMSNAQVQALTKKSNYIKVTGAAKAASAFSSELLAKLDTRFLNWAVTIDMDDVTGLSATNKVETTVPAGWIAVFKSVTTPLAPKTYNPGDVVTVAEKGTIVLTKQNVGTGSAWLKITELNAALGKASAGNQFQYDNVDFDVPANLGDFATPAASVTVLFRYKLTAGKVTGAAGWSYDPITGIATYTKP